MTLAVGDRVRASHLVHGTGSGARQANVVYPKVHWRVEGFARQVVGYITRTVVKLSAQKEGTPAGIVRWAAVEDCTKIEPPPFPVAGTTLTGGLGYRSHGLCVGPCRRVISGEFCETPKAAVESYQATMAAHECSVVVGLDPARLP